jgi:hypothetical protein
MLGVDSEIGTSALRLWVTAGSAAMLVFFCALTFVQPTTRAVRAILVALGAVLGAAITWASFGGGSSSACAERRALEQRAAELAVRTLAPGLPLACLDALAGENVEIACEKDIFASPASVATATSYVAARLALLSDITAYTGRGGDAVDALLPLRRALEADRFGFLAHVLVMRDNCTNENCKAFALLRDPGQVRANLSGETFKHYLEHYLPVWAKASDATATDATQVQTTATTQVNPPGPRKATVKIDLPSAASITAVNIMNPEPTGPVLSGVAAANPNRQPTAPPSSRRSHKQATRPPAQAAVQPAASGSTPPVEPIWPEPAPPLPSAPTAAPVQLSPFAPAPPSDANEANRGRGAQTETVQ